MKKVFLMLAFMLALCVGIGYTTSERAEAMLAPTDLVTIDGYEYNGNFYPIVYIESQDMYKVVLPQSANQQGAPDVTLRGTYARTTGTWSIVSLVVGMQWVQADLDNGTWRSTQSYVGFPSSTWRAGSVTEAKRTDASGTKDVKVSPVLFWVCVGEVP